MTKVLLDTDKAAVIEAVSGATITDAGTPASDDKVLIQDTSDSDNLKYVTISDLPGRGAVNAQTGTTYTLVIGDEYLDGVRQTNAAANTITIPPNADVAFPVGSTKIFIIQGGAGATTIAAGAGVTLNAPASAPLAIGEIHGSRVCQKTATDTWLII
jgi:hypothetical protein